VKYFMIRIVERNWRVDDIFLCNEKQLPIIESLGFYMEKTEINHEEYKNFKFKYRNYKSFLKSFDCFPSVKFKLEEMKR